MTPAYQTPSPAAQVRPKLVWVWVAVALMVIAFVTTMVLLFTNVSRLQGDLDELPRLEPGESAVLDLDPGTYLVYVEGYSETFLPDVSVVGDDGEVPVVQSSVTEEYDIGDFRGRSNSQFIISEAGSYGVFNYSSDRIAVGPSLIGKLVRAVVVPFGIGAVLGISGLVLLIVTLVRRRRSKSQLAYGPGPGPGVPFQGFPGQPGQYPTGQYPTGQNPPGQVQPGQYSPGQDPGAPTMPGPADGGMPPPPPPSPGQWPQT